MTQEYEEITLDHIAVVDKGACPGANVEMRKRAKLKDAAKDARVRLEKRLKKSQSKITAKYYAELSKIERGEPIVKKRKKRKPVIVEQEQTFTEPTRQPDRIGSSAHLAPASYPVGKALATVAASHEAHLQREADQYCQTVLAKGRTSPGPMGVDRQAGLSAYDQMRKETLFDRSAEMRKNWKGDGPVVGTRKNTPATSDAYAVLCKAAQDRHDLDPGRTYEQHFSDVYQSREFAELALADRAFNRNRNVDAASVALAKRGGRTVPPNSDETDDDELNPHDDDQLDGDFDDDGEKSNMDLRPDRGEPAASSASGGSANADYEMSGTNRMMTGPQASSGRNSGSYNDRKRSASNTRRSR
jgi:hypothetical protein